MIQITSIEKAVEFYYAKMNLNGKDISELFGGVSRATVCKLKKLAREEMKNMGFLYGIVCTLRPKQLTVHGV